MFVVIQRDQFGSTKHVEMLERKPTFAPEVGATTTRVYEGNINGGDSIELRWTGEEWVNPLAPKRVAKATVPVAVLDSLLEKLESILSGVGCGQMDMPDFDEVSNALDDAENAAREAQDYVDSARDSLPGVDDLQSQIEQANTAVGKAEDLRDELTLIIQNTRSGELTEQELNARDEAMAPRQP